MTAAISTPSQNIETHKLPGEVRPEFSGGATLLAVIALYALQNILLKVMKMYSEFVANQKNSSLDMAAKSGENIKDAGAMQATSMILAGVGSLVGAGLAVGFTAYGSKALRQTQTEMKGVTNKLSIVDQNLKMMDQVASQPKGTSVSKGTRKDPVFDRFDASRIPVVRYNARTGRVKFEPRRNEAKNRFADRDMPQVVSHSDLKPHLQRMDKSKFEKGWDAMDRRHLESVNSSAPEFKRLDGTLRSEQKSLNKRMDTLSGEHNAELNKATQRSQLSNSFAQGAGQTSSGIPHVAKGEYDSAAQFTKAVGEQIESSSRQSEEARNQTLQSANHINQILDQLKASEKAN